MDPASLLSVTTIGTGPGGLTTIEPRDNEADPIGIVHEARQFIEQRLLESGALVFRGFQIDDAPLLDAFSRAISPEIPQFAEESSPRSQVLGAVYTSTDYPKDYPIQFHNEYSYASRWPMKLYFSCAVPAEDRGATPIADSRRVLGRLSPAVRERFLARKVLYVRNFMQGLGVPWQKAFQTDDKLVVERYCASVGIECQWGADERLTTRQIGDAIVRHPHTKEEVWFNHGWFFNVAGLEPASLRAFFQRQPEDTLSTNTYYGDESSIEPEVFEQLRAAYQAETRRFDWQSGDVLLIDNMLTSHGREPFSGERKILCVMAQPCDRADLKVPA